MGGRASIIMVVGFAIIFGYINLNMAKLTSNSIENMVGYNQIAMSRNFASAGANVGLAILTKTNYPHNARILASKNYTGTPFNNGGYIVRIDSLSLPQPHLRMRSVSTCTTYLYTDQARTQPYIIKDTVEVRFDYVKKINFSSFGWLTNNEGGVYFTSGDTLWGKIHSNSTINIDNKPVFWGKVTTTGNFNPKTNSGKFFGGKETGVATVPFPNDMSELSVSATNIASSRTVELWVELKPGTAGDNDGYAIIRTGSFSGPKVDSIKLSDVNPNVIYSSQDIHVKGTLDGRLTIASHNDLKLEGNTVYERPPDVYNNDPDLLLPQNQTKDMLGLVARSDVIIPSNYHGNISIDGSIFAETGSFKAENWNGSSEGRINIRGSICQSIRGAVGTTGGSGYKKSYRFDPRFSDKFSEDPDMHPPSFPGFLKPSTLHIQNWWESKRKPLQVAEYYN